MVSLSEMFGPKATLPFVIPTYTAMEGGNVDLSYQLEMMVNANIPNEAKQNKLVTFVKNELGYEKCDIDPQSNTVRVYNLSGIDKERVMKFIKKIDKNASVRSTA